MKYKIYLVIILILFSVGCASHQSKYTRTEKIDTINSEENTTEAVTENLPIVWYFVDTSVERSSSQIIHEALLETERRGEITYKYIEYIGDSEDLEIAYEEKDDITQPDLIFAPNELHHYIFNKFKNRLLVDIDKAFKDDYLSEEYFDIDFIIPGLGISFGEFTGRFTMEFDDGYPGNQNDFENHMNNFGKDFSSEMDKLLGADIGSKLRGGPGSYISSWSLAWKIIKLVAKGISAIGLSLTAAHMYEKGCKEEPKDAGPAGGVTVEFPQGELKVKFPPGKRPPDAGTGDDSSRMPRMPGPEGGGDECDFFMVLNQAVEMYKMHKLWWYIKNGIPLPPENISSASDLEDFKLWLFQQGFTDSYNKLKDGQPLSGDDTGYAFYYWILSESMKGHWGEGPPRWMILWKKGAPYDPLPIPHKRSTIYVDGFYNQEIAKLRLNFALLPPITKVEE